MKYENLRKSEIASWIPREIKAPLKKAMKREVIDLTSQEHRSIYLANPQEALDLQDLLNQFENPLFIGMNGSRAERRRNILFNTLEDFDNYYTGVNRDFYHEEEIILSRKYFKKRDFNTEYEKGKKFPDWMVQVLVRDLDLIVFDKNAKVRSGTHSGKRTNVVFDLTVYNVASKRMMESPIYPEDFIYTSIDHARPLKVKEK